ncbi:MAG: septum formation initiator family protein [Firmicutes bacterium]|jgi:cell division protein FtsL|nr:septum formation initiator family protein [Dethiobacter sp.]MBS3899870.1 septum formation initiator family protein [Dethiobacter sp.]MCL4463880.1 septum formation initiator family protein [Bacillota bacterium]MCL5992648.1 septum formation initiator family protein [Bacillota bacterium]
MKAKPVQQNRKLAYLPEARRRSPAGNKLVKGLIIVLILYFVFLFATQSIRLLQMRRTLSSIEAEIQAVRLQNEEMLREIEQLHSPAYLEKMAREELGMVRSGELLFLFRE